MAKQVIPNTWIYVSAMKKVKHFIKKRSIFFQ